MKRLLRLLHFLRPYTLPALIAVVLLATVGLLEAFRILLVKPIFDKVLDPSVEGSSFILFRLPISHHPVELQSLVPRHFHNAWAMVAFALVASTVLKSL